VPIYALSPLALSRRRMALYRDVYPIPHVPQGKKMEKVLRNVIRLLLEQGRIKVGDRVILTMGDRLANEGGTNTMRFMQVADEGIAEGQNQLDLG
jgi:pyruvate kinase